MSDGAAVDFSEVDVAEVLDSPAAEPVADPTPDPEPEPADIPDASSEVDTAQTRENPDGQDDQQDRQPTDKTPGRSDIHKLIRSFRDANPEHAAAAKILNDEYGRALAFKEVYPTVEEARTVKAQIDSIGGLEGLADLQSTVASIEQTDSLLESGNPQVIEQIFEDAPQGAARLAGPYLDKLAKVNPEAYRDALRPHVVDLLAGARLGDVLNAALSSIQSQKAEDATRIIQNVLQWLGEEKNLAEKFKQDYFGPDRQKLSDEWSKLQSERDSDFRKSVDTSVISSTNTELRTLLKPYLSADLTDTQKRDIAQACYNELGKAVWTKAFNAHVKGLLSSKNRKVDTVANVIRSAISEKLPKVVEKVAQDYRLGKKAAKAAPARRAAPAGSPTTPTKGVRSEGVPGYEWRGSRLVKIGS